MSFENTVYLFDRPGPSKRILTLQTVCASTERDGIRGQSYGDKWLILSSG